MGLGNKLIVSATGFPGTNKTLRFLQDAFREPLGALAQLAGDKTIIAGVKILPNADPQLPATVTSGFITYNGEIIPFVGGDYANTVTIIETFENVNYNTDANDDTVLDSLPAYRTIYARCGNGGIDLFNFSDLSPLMTIKELSNVQLPNGLVIDPNYLAFTQAMLDHLNSIEQGAEVNVQADWAVANVQSDAFIKNKPTNLLQPLYRGTSYLGDFPNGTDELRTISFPALTTANYFVLGSFVSLGSNWNNDNDVFWMIRNKTITSFQLIGREVAGHVQNLRFDYIILPLF